MVRRAHRRSGDQGQTWAIFVLIFALLVVIVFGAFYGSTDDRDRYLEGFAIVSERASRQLGEHARQSFGQVNLALWSAEQAFKRTSGPGSADAADSGKLSDSMRKTLGRLAASVPQIRSIHIADASGKILFSSLGLPANKLRVADKAYFKALMSGSLKRLVSTSHNDGPAGTVITVAHRMSGPQGKLIGIVVATVTPDYFKRFYAAAAREWRGTVALISTNGTVLAAHGNTIPAGYRPTGRKVTEAAFLKGLPQVQLEPDQSRYFINSDAVGAFYRLFDRQLLVAVVAPRQAALADWRAAFWRRLLIVGAIALVICGFLVVLWWQLMERARAGQRLFLQSAAMGSTDSAMFISDLEDRVSWTNAAFNQLSGYSQDEVIGRNVAGLLVREGEQDTDAGSRAETDETADGSASLQRKDGNVSSVMRTVTPIRTDGKNVTHYVTVLEEIGETLSANEKARRREQYDALTALPNRNLFLYKIEEAMSRSERTEKPFGVVVLDVDRFKDINDALGHDVGDNLLALVAKQISKQVRKTDTLARLDGDQFVVLVDMLTDEASVSTPVQRLTKAFEKPFEISGKSVSLTASVGIAVFVGQEKSANEVLRNAVSAMNQAKQSGPGNLRYFDSDMDKTARERIEIGSELKEALSGRQFWLALQPQIDLRTGAITGAEALARWTHPERGLVSPGLFIPVAEANNAILDIDDWVIQQACKEIKELNLGQLPRFVLGINLSASQYEQDDMVDRIVQSLSTFKIPTDRLEVEITETAAMSQSDKVAENVKKLEKVGIKVSIDDFGTGYSSLSYLRDFPVSRLKIDSSFVWGIGKNPRDEAIVEAVVGLGHNLGLRVIAEGVETSEQLEFLRSCGCDELQGYFIGKPMPPEEFVEFVQQYQPFRAA